MILLLIPAAVGIVALLLYLTMLRSADRALPIPREGSSPSPQLSTDRDLVQAAVRGLSYHGGEWMPSRYNTPDWEKYQDAAVASAALGTTGRASPTDRAVAAATVTAAIAHHQRGNGDFDAGTAAAGTSSVSGGFWAEAEGLIALSLRADVAASTLTSWERSMAAYVRYLESSHDASWYANGNVVLRQDLIMLETYDLARAVHDPNAAMYWGDYLRERQFLVNPSSISRKGAVRLWQTYGEYTDASDALWFDESPTSAPTARISCANGTSPCRGFDPNYTMAQLHDAIVAYTVGGDDSFWLRVIRGEYAALKPKISGGQLNASGGSRYNIPREVFYPPVYVILNGLNRQDPAWSRQLRAIQTALQASERSPDPGPNTYSAVMALAEPILIAARQS